MGKAGRFACILTPMLLTLASLICFVLVMIGQAPFKGNGTPSTALGRELYFFKADTSKFTADPSSILDTVPGADRIDNSLLDSLTGSASAGALADFYQIGLWSYCEGSKGKDGGNETMTKCSARKFQFYFNPVDVWDLHNTSVQEVLGDKFTSGMETYKKVAGWMNWAFVITVVLTGVEMVVGVFAVFSRWGSLVTTIISISQALFALAAATTATALYGTLTGIFKTALARYAIDASMSSQMLGVLWLAVAFSLASALFWLASVCCCSASSPHKKLVVEKTPYTYERVESPAFGQPANGDGLGMRAGLKMPTPYEPFRNRV